MLEIGKKYLITTSEYFIAPDGQSYRAAFGKVHAVEDSKQTLGIQTNRNATNWYVRIGNMTIAGCQIHYVIKTDSCDTETRHTSEHDGREYTANSRIFRAE